MFPRRAVAALRCRAETTAVPCLPHSRHTDSRDPERAGTRRGGAPVSCRGACCPEAGRRPARWLSMACRVRILSSSQAGQRPARAHWRTAGMRMQKRARTCLSPLVKSRVFCDRIAKCNAEGGKRATMMTEDDVFGAEHDWTQKRATGSWARAGSPARPGSERRRPTAGRRPVPSTGQDNVVPAHCGPAALGLRSLRSYGGMSTVRPGAAPRLPAVLRALPTPHAVPVARPPLRSGPRGLGGESEPPRPRVVRGRRGREEDPRRGSAPRRASASPGPVRVWRGQGRGGGLASPNGVGQPFMLGSCRIHTARLGAVGHRRGPPRTRRRRRVRGDA